METIIEALAKMAGWSRQIGLSSSLLIGLGTLFTVSFLLSLREILAWLLGVPQLRAEIQALRETMAAQAKPEPQPLPVAWNFGEKAGAPAKPRFELRDKPQPFIKPTPVATDTLKNS